MLIRIPALSRSPVNSGLVFDLELADLPVQLGFGFLPVLVGPLSPVGEEVGQLLQKLRLPAADLVGVDAEHAGQLGDGFLALNGLQGNLGLERCLILVPHTDHCAIPPC